MNFKNILQAEIDKKTIKPNTVKREIKNTSITAEINVYGVYNSELTRSEKNNVINAFKFYY